MLESLSARGFVLIDSLRMDFSSGFVALTGETGAGKSLLVDALSLLRGGRARPDLARDGGAAEVEAVFDISARPDARARLAAAGLCDSESASEPLVVRRVVAADGKSRAFINGRAATIGQLREIVGEIVEICGQRAHHSLLQAAAQRDLIDDFAAARGERESVAVDFGRFRDCARAVAAAAKQKDESRLREIEEEIAAIEALDFSPPRWSEANAALTRLARAEDLLAACAKARAEFETDGGAATRLAAMRRELEALAAIDSDAAAAAALLGEAQNLLHETERALARLGEKIETDPQALIAAERFVADAHALARRQRLQGPEEIPALLARLRTAAARLAAIDIDRLRAEEAAARKRLDRSCAALSVKRKKAGAVFARRVSALLRDLSMPEAVFAIEWEAVDPPGETGAEQARFLLSTIADAPPGALEKIASGGELARIGLAAQIAAAESSPTPPVAVFDEVDAGVGGRAAAAIGRMLAQLGATRQTLCVTHLAPVAARADSHWRIFDPNAEAQKSGAKNAAKKSARAAQAAALDPAARVEEIARMIGGARSSAATREAAAEMLQADGAGGEKV